MKAIDRVGDFRDDLVAWRRWLHAHPELSYEEHETSAFVAGKLEGFGIETHRGLAGTGVVGVLKGGTDGPGTVALRADMDALPIHEDNDFDHRSTVPGRMHACGHDGHTTMLLGAARYLAETRDFAGTACFVFQPAEEMGGEDGGSARMIREGLFERFGAESIYGVHNWPGMPAGRFAVKSGPMMASGDSFRISVKGPGGHAAQPQKTVDSVLVASHVVVALQAISSRETDPLRAVVVGATQIHGGDAYNVIPNSVEVRGTVRVFDPDVRSGIEPALRRIVGGVAAAFGAEVEVEYKRDYPTLVNEETASAHAARVAGEVFGEENVDRDPPRTMIVEDFAFMLEGRRGCYAWIGNGPDGAGRALHGSRYDFNDDALTLGAAYLARLVETTLPKA